MATDICLWSNTKRTIYSFGIFGSWREKIFLRSIRREHASSLLLFVTTSKVTPIKLSFTFNASGSFRSCQIWEIEKVKTSQTDRQCSVEHTSVDSILGFLLSSKPSDEPSSFCFFSFTGNTSIVKAGYLPRNRCQWKYQCANDLKKVGIYALKWVFNIQNRHLIRYTSLTIQNQMHLTQILSKCIATRTMTKDIRAFFFGGKVSLCPTVYVLLISFLMSCFHSSSLLLQSLPLHQSPKLTRNQRQWESKNVAHTYTMFFFNAVRIAGLPAKTTMYSWWIVTMKTRSRLKGIYNVTDQACRCLLIV